MEITKKIADDLLYTLKTWSENPNDLTTLCGILIGIEHVLHIQCYRAKKLWYAVDVTTDEMYIKDSKVIIKDKKNVSNNKNNKKSNRKNSVVRGSDNGKNTDKVIRLVKCKKRKESKNGTV